MKTQWRFLLVALLFLLPSAHSWAEEPSRIETEVEEKLLDKVQIAEQERTLIKIAEDKIFEFDKYPDREEMKAALGLKLPEKVKQQILARGGSIEEADPMQAYESLPEDRKQKFQEMRLMFLANAARIMN